MLCGEKIIEAISSAWGWAGIRPEELVAENDFGNVIVRDREGSFWRIVPEDPSCSVVATDQASLASVLQSEEFTLDWNMTSLVDMARLRLGPLAPGRKYCLKVPAILGGAYDIDNIGTISFVELVSVSGSIAHQLEDLPDGAHVKLVITE
jgi:hypothetical protein